MCQGFCFSLVSMSFSIPLLINEKSEIGLHLDGVLSCFFFLACGCEQLFLSVWEGV